jgi:hypothetical protein
MLQLGLILVLVTGLIGAGVAFISSVKESGRAECRAEHIEAARMGELRARERAGKASTQFEKERTQIGNRERDVSRSVASAASDSGCLSPGVLDTINSHLREARGAGKPDSAVPGPTRHTGQK